MRVAVVAEFYPRRHDPVLGVWAHRQALAARDAGAEVSVFVLHRLVPPRRELAKVWALARQPSAARLDGLAVRYLVIGDGPERGRLAARARELGLADRVEFTGQLAPAEAMRRAGAAWCFVMPSTEEAFGVAYIEAMAAGIAAIGCSGEPGPAEIAAAGGGIELVPPRDPDALAACLRRLLGDDAGRRELGERARETVEAQFTWRRCGEQTLAAYAEALR